MDLIPTLRTTGAVRRFTAEPVPDAAVYQLLDDARFAPSGGNRQPWKFVAVLDAERRAWVAERYRKAFHAYIAAAVEAAKAPDFPEAGRRNQRAAIHLADHLHEAPVHLFVAGFTRRGEPQLQALMPAVQNVLLACRAVGLGASLTTLHRSFGAECDRFLGLPEGCPSCALLPIGWPLGRCGRPPRRPIDECCYVDRHASEVRSEA